MLISWLKKDSIKELVAAFSSPDISYVTGRLVLVNKDDSETASLENIYWDLMLCLRKIESDIHTITVGNGALYACRNDEYFDFEPIECHDISMF